MKACYQIQSDQVLGDRMTLRKELLRTVVAVLIALAFLGAAITGGKALARDGSDGEGDRQRQDGDNRRSEERRVGKM